MSDFIPWYEYLLFAIGVVVLVNPEGVVKVLSMLVLQ